MTGPMFEVARERGRGDRIGQLNPMGRYGVPEGMSDFINSFRTFRLEENAAIIRLRNTANPECSARQRWPIIRSDSYSSDISPIRLALLTY